MKREDILRAIYSAIERVNELQPPGKRLARTEATRLYGGEGSLDSLGLVALVVDVEQALSDESGVPVVLADEHALAQGRSPFRNVESFTDYILQRLDGSER
jgi:acyl carrier protein